MKPTTSVIDLLRSVTGLTAVPDATLAQLVPVLDQADIPAGHVLTQEGVVGRSAYIIVEGRGQVFVDGEAVATVARGDIVGNTGLLNGQWGSATVRARSPMRVLVSGAEALSRFVQHHDKTEPSTVSAQAGVGARPSKGEQS
jgi:CRP-like cAMP-binding protein